MVNKRPKKSSRARAAPAPTLVSLIDDDQSVRQSLPDLLRALGFADQAFASADDLLRSDYVSASRCLILDIAMPGMSGPELQRKLSLRGHTTKIIFITAQGDQNTRRQLIARGAIDCLFKPFSGQSLGCHAPTERTV
jgi:FixJ family two-component response regulator